jgi:CubicO group peptidase (beta-lactamase class C family)
MNTSGSFIYISKQISFVISTFIFLFVACAGNDDSRIVDQTASARIDSTLLSFVESGDLAGIMALVYEKDKETYYNAFGMADREAVIPMARNTIVQIYSMTKPITGVALMQLYEKGEFDLDDPVSKYAEEFSEMRVYVGRDASGIPIYELPRREMTIRDLTRHTAGFAPNVTVEGVGELLRAADPMNLENTLNEMAKRLGSVPLWFHPGERWSYGPSVDVQAFLVERLSGMPFNEYLQENIFNPLGMKDTGYFVREDDRSRFSALYLRDEDGTLTRVPDEQAYALNTRTWTLTPGGFGLVSTIDDYVRFARMLVRGGELDGVRILQPETVRLMATNHLPEDVIERSWLPSKGSVGFGIDFAVRTDPPASAEENYGVVGEFFWDGYASTLFWVDPTNELTAVLFVQLIPFDQIGLHKAFRDAVYGEYDASGND